jgi:hypothetical protein
MDTLEFLDCVRGPHRYPGLGLAVAMTHDTEALEFARSKNLKMTPFEMARDDDRPWHEVVIPIKTLDEWESAISPF